MKSSITDSINSLPPLPKTILEINRVYADEEAGINDMTGVIEVDPMIVANLLKAANSPLYAFGNEIKNVSQAVSLFGMGMTRSIAIGNSIRKLLNVDMNSYGVSSDDFADISSMQAKLIINWYSKIDKEKADRLYLAAFLQETGKILISSYIMQEDEETSFKSEVELTNNVSSVEKLYVDVTSSEITARVFEHWKFNSDFVDMIKFADNPQEAKDDIKEFATALNIVKTIVPINKPFSEQSVNFGMKKAKDAGYDTEILDGVIKKMINILEENV